MEEIDYGKWCTYNGKRYMITDWSEDKEDVQLFSEGASFWVGAKHLFDISDFMLTPAQRRMAGFAF